MAIESSAKKKYDVAISFLVEDLTLAQAIRDKLSESLDVFFFPHNQEQLAGTDGLESMRIPFLEESRVNLVLYRERWGNTPWTRVESTAIQEACLSHGWDGLFFFMVEPKDQPPKWLPRTHVRLNYGDFTLEQAIGAIKARVQEQGGHFVPMTPARRAALLKAEDDYRSLKSQLNSGEGLALIDKQVMNLFSAIEAHCEEIIKQGHSTIRYESVHVPRSTQQKCVLTNNRVSLSIIWHQTYLNSLEGSGLFVNEFKGRMLLDSERRQGMMLFDEPVRIAQEKYEPELSRTGELGWKPANESHFIPSSILAEKCAILFVDLIEKSNSGGLDR